MSRITASDLATSPTLARCLSPADRKRYQAATPAEVAAKRDNRLESDLRRECENWLTLRGYHRLTTGRAVAETLCKWTNNNQRGTHEPHSTNQGRKDNRNKRLHKGQGDQNALHGVHGLRGTPEGLHKPEMPVIPVSGQNAGGITRCQGLADNENRHLRGQEDVLEQGGATVTAGNGANRPHGWFVALPTNRKASVFMPDLLIISWGWRHCLAIELKRPGGTPHYEPGQREMIADGHWLLVRSLDELIEAVGER